MSLGHKKLASWYYQLGQQLDAGLTFAESLRFSKGTGLPARVLDTMARTVESGGSIDDALKHASGWLPPADQLFLSASAAAGRMPRTLHVLSARHEQVGAAKLRVLLACLYPAAIVHMGILLLPVARMIDWQKGFTWDSTAYLRGLAFTLVPLWSAAVVTVILIRRENPLVARVSRMIPIVRSYLKAQSLSDFCFGLGNFLQAGVPIDRAWPAAARVSRSPELIAAAELIGPVIARGAQPGERLAEIRCFPPDFVALYRSGEASGQLDQNLLRLASVHQESAQRALSLATVVYPGLMLVGVAGGVAYFVISIYGGYLKMLTGLMDP
jgi:general secretion pathway protein F/type IV pilus assembly protein PilC